MVPNCTVRYSEKWGTLYFHPKTTHIPYLPPNFAFVHFLRTYFRRQMPSNWQLAIPLCLVIGLQPVFDFSKNTGRLFQPKGSKPEARMTESGGRFLGRGQLAPCPPARESGER